MTCTDQLFLTLQRRLHGGIRGTGATPKRRLTAEVLCTLDPKGDLQCRHEWERKRANVMMSFGGAM